MFNLLTWTNSLEKLQRKNMSLKYFTLDEFDDTPGTGKNMKKDFLLKLDEAREIAGIPFNITSGWRSIKTNERLIKEGYKASKNSSHLAGVAADIACNDSLNRVKIVAALVRAGFTRIGVSDKRGFIHVDSDITKNDALWIY
tara:strand:- start:173 stop:598 length:426 start_codon:yes stop_codon:yes gene_type:complete